MFGVLGLRRHHERRYRVFDRSASVARDHARWTRASDAGRGKAVSPGRSRYLFLRGIGAKVDRPEFRRGLNNPAVDLAVILRDAAHNKIVIGQLQIQGVLSRTQQVQPTAERAEKSPAVTEPACGTGRTRYFRVGSGVDIIKNSGSETTGYLFGAGNDPTIR